MLRLLLAAPLLAGLCFTPPSLANAASPEDPLASGPGAEMLRHVPHEARFCARVSSLDELRRFWSLLSANNPEIPPELDVDTLIGSVWSIDLEALDPSLPALLYTLEPESGDSSYFVAFLPTRDAKRLHRSLEYDLEFGGQTLARLNEHYMVLTDAPGMLDLELADAPLVARLEPGVYSMVVDAREMAPDVAELVAALPAMEMMARMELATWGFGPDLTAELATLVGTLSGGVKALAEDLAFATMTMALETEVAHFDLTFELDEAAAWTRDYASAPVPQAELAALMDGGSMLSMATSAGLGAWLEAAWPTVEAEARWTMGEPEEPLALDVLAAGRELVALGALFGGATVGTVDFDEVGFGAELWTTNVSGAELERAFRELFDGALGGFGFGLAEDAERWRATFDPERFLDHVGADRPGPEDVAAEVAAVVDDLPTFAFKDRPDTAGGLAIGRPTSSGRTSGPLRHALARVGDDAEYLVLHAQLLRCFEAELVASFEAIFGPGLSAAEREELFTMDMPFALYAAFDGRQLRLGMAAPAEGGARANQLLAHAAHYNPSAATLAAFEADVLPIFEETCTGCHGARRQREGLRVDSVEGLLAGSDWGPVLVPGVPEESYLVELIQLPLHDEYHMPPRKKRQLTPDQIETIVSWVRSMEAAPSGPAPR